MTPRKPSVLIWAALVCAVGAGCQGLTAPKLVGPGPADYQRRVAHQFDPYPDRDLLGDTTGGRPLDYIDPPPETQKARWDPHGMLRRFGGTAPR